MRRNARGIKAAAPGGVKARGWIAFRFCGQLRALPVLACPWGAALRGARIHPVGPSVVRDSGSALYRRRLAPTRRAPDRSMIAWASRGESYDARLFVGKFGGRIVFPSSWILQEIQ